MSEQARSGRHALHSGPITVDAEDDGAAIGTDFGSLLLPIANTHHVAVTASGHHGLDTVIVTALDAEATLAVTAYATPRSGGYGEWAEHANRVQSHQVGAIGVVDREGPLGSEIIARLPTGGHRTFFTVEGACWLLRAVLHSRPGRSYSDRMRARAFLAASGVRRGAGAVPPGDPLPIVIPTDWVADS